MGDPITITNNDLGSVLIEEHQSEDAAVIFAGTDTYAEGTILARFTTAGANFGKLQLYAKGGSSNGNGVPQAILTYELSRTGAGDKQARVVTAGKFNKKRLVIDADGDDSNVDAVVLDLLREHGMLCEESQQLSRYDNPQPSEVDS